jgi:hypothetical protein
MEFGEIFQNDILPGENPAKDFSSKLFLRFSLCQATAIAKLINLSIKN